MNMYYVFLGHSLSWFVNLFLHLCKIEFTSVEFISTQTQQIKTY